MLTALLGAIVGGVLTALGALVAVSAADRRARRQFQRQVQLEAARDALTALQNVNRKMINLARDATDASAASDNTFWSDVHEAATQWNAARYGAMLVGSSNEVETLYEVDHEIDRLLDLAMAKQWRSRDFRSERAELGRLGARYLQAVRSATDQSPIRVTTLWPWDGAGES